jgi:adenosylhomocysteine nucleosidase
MTIGIIAAMDEEIRYITEKMTVIRRECLHPSDLKALGRHRRFNETQQLGGVQARMASGRENTPRTSKTTGTFDFYFGTLAGKQVALSLSGIGKVNAAISTTLLIQLFDCQIIVNTGSAAGLSPGMVAGDVVISDRVIHHDVDATAFDYALGQVPRMPLAYEADKDLVDMLSHFSDPDFPHQIHVGCVSSGDAFVCDARPIKENFPVAVALDMESSGVAQTCYRFAVPFVVVRSISDDGGEGAKMTHEAFLEIAGENSAVLTEFLVGRL